MTVPGNLSSPLLATAADAAAAAANITKSVRFNKDDGAYLSRTPSSAGNRKTWTWAGWVKLGRAQTDRYTLWECTNNFGGGQYGLLNIDSNGKFGFGESTGGSYTSAQLRDHSAWYHLVAAMDTTQSTAADRFKTYINGVEAYNSGYTFTQNADTAINQSGVQHNIGREENSDIFLADLYMADVYFIDGSALDPTSFGSFDSNGVWQAAAYSGTFGTNGFHLFDFVNESGIGNDSSGNDNDFTVNNISEVVPTGSYTVTRAQYTVGVGDQYDPYATVDGSLATGDSYADRGYNNNGLSYSGLPQATQSIRINCNLGGGTTTLNANHGSGDVRTFTASATDTGIWKTMSGTVSSSSPYTLTKITADGGNNTSSYFALYAIEIDGVIIVDNRFGKNNDVLRDVPVNGDSSDDTGAGGELSSNYCTWNPLDSQLNFASLANGNLEHTGSSSGSYFSFSAGTIGFDSSTSTGFYFEVTQLTYGESSSIGLHDTAYPVAGLDYGSWIGSSGNPNGISYVTSGTVYNFGSTISSQGTYTSNGDVIGVAVKDNKIWFSKNGTYISGNPSTGTSPTATLSSARVLTPIINGFTSGVYALNAGQRAFNTAAPTGFKALCTSNLSTPTIADGGAHFDAAIYTGTGSNISVPLGLEPDFVWTKSRSTTTVHVLQNSVSGITTKYLQLPGTDQEYDGTGGVQSTSATGFVQGTGSGVNASGSTYVSWAWNAGANSSKTYTVKVVSDSGNKYRFDDFGTSAVTLDLAEGSTYVFDQSDSSNSGHPLRFSTTSDGTHGGGSEYTTGVTTTGTPGSAGAKTTIVVGSSVATLYYYCSAHSGMGGQANTNSTAGSSNFDGNIQSTVKANQTAGFSIVTWTGTGSAQTVGHGLGAKPEFIFSHRRSGAGQWPVYHSANGATKYQYLNSTIEARTYQYFWNNTEPTSSVFSIGSDADVSLNGGTHIAFCFTPVAGYSAIGKFNSTNSTDNAFVYTGFRPRFLLWKKIDDTGSWGLYDAARNPFNAVDKLLLANASDAESTLSTPPLDFLSNGFKVRSTLGTTNDLAYICFAENPFQANGGLAR